MRGGIEMRGLANVALGAREGLCWFVEVVSLRLLARAYIAGYDGP